MPTTPHYFRVSFFSFCVSFSNVLSLLIALTFSYLLIDKYSTEAAGYRKLNYLLVTVLFHAKTILTNCQFILVKVIEFTSTTLTVLRR
jgi:hypothetical protein